MRYIRNFLIFLLVASIFTSGIKFNIELGSGTTVNLGLTQILALLGFVGMFFFSLTVGKPIPLFYKDRFSLLLYLYAGCNFFSSIFFSDNRGHAIKSAIVVLMYVMIYQTVRWIAQTQEETFKLLRYLRNSNYASAWLGLITMVAALVSGTGNFGVALGHINGEAPSIRALTFEPNIFAITTAAVLMFSISENILGIRQRGTQLLMIISLLLSILFAYTRSVYVSLIFSLMVTMKVLKKITLNFAVNILVITAVVAGLIFLAPKDNFIRDAFVSKTVNMFNFEEGNGLGRVEVYLIGWAGFRSSPVFGKGTMSANTDVINETTGEIQQAQGSEGWLSGALIQCLHDTGIIGGVVMLAVFLSIILINYKSFKREKDITNRSILLGFFAGNIVMAISSQLSSVLWIAFPYCYWAINMAFISQLDHHHKKTKELGIVNSTQHVYG